MQVEQAPGGPNPRRSTLGFCAEPDLRQELARELHDLVVQELTATLVDLENFKRLPHDELTIAKCVEEVQRTLRSALQELRHLVCGLRGQEECESADFLGCLRDFGHRFRERTGVSVSLAVDGDWTSGVHSLTAKHLQRIVREAVNNAYRHGQARNVCVSLQADADLVHLTVQDDGRGVGLENAADLGMGTVGMQERAVLLGGSIAVEPRPEGGTLVRVDFPRAALAVREISTPPGAGRALSDLWSVPR